MVEVVGIGMLDVGQELLVLSELVLDPDLEDRDLCEGLGWMEL